MKRLLTLAALALCAVPASACDWWPGKALGRPDPRATGSPSWSACVSGPPLALTFTYTPANGTAVVNPVRSALGRWVAPATCVGGRCEK